MSANPDHEAAYNAAGIGVFLIDGAESLTGEIPDARLVPIDQSVTLWIASAEILYTGGGDDFAARARGALRAWRQP